MARFLSLPQACADMSSPLHGWDSRIIRGCVGGITSCLRLRTNFDNRVLVALSQSASLSVPATSPREVLTQVHSKRVSGLGRTPLGSTIALPHCVRLATRAWPASLCRGVPLASDSHWLSLQN